MNQNNDPQKDSPAGSSNMAPETSGQTGKRQSFKVQSKKQTNEQGSSEEAIAQIPISTLSDEPTPAGIDNAAATGPSGVPVSTIVTDPPASTAAAPHLEKDENDWQEERPRKGRRPGDRYIRMTKSNLKEVQREIYGLSFRAGENSAPTSGFGRFWRRTKRLLIGRPLPTSMAQHERLSKVQALAVLSSDALSSVAYALDEILLVLILAGTAALGVGIPIALCIGALLVIVGVSYRQTIAAYPKGGGSYIVAKDNLGVTPGLIAAASLLTDYVLTVAVSISSGVQAITSAFPDLDTYRVEICLVFVAFITISNLRGIRESGMIFTAPTYLFIFSIGLLLLFGFIKLVFGWGIGGEIAYNPKDLIPPGTEQLTLFLILRAFASGCTAMTGVEAISDGVPAFKAPEAKNARITLLWMVGILLTMFVSITFLANAFNVRPSDTETVISQIAHHAVGNSFIYYLVQAATAMILVLAANTAFSDFPRLSWFLARDRFLPNLFRHQGDRLAFSTGIITLALLASTLIILFKGETTLLIPLYAVGVFTSFTLSQAGMVMRWWRLRTPGWNKSIILNGLGCLVTFVVAIIIAITKFIHGAWIVICLIPILYLMFLSIHRHYSRMRTEIRLDRAQKIKPLPMEAHTVVVPISDLNQVTLRTLSYARALSDDVTAIFVSDNSDAIEQLRQRWEESDFDIPLVAVETPYRAVIGPIMKYVDELHRSEPNETITVIIPEFVPAHWWQRLLHNQTALRLKTALFSRPGIVITSVPYHLEK